MRIAAVQLYIDHHEKSSNWVRIEHYAKIASERNVDLLIFPEYVIGGPGPDSVLGKEASEKFCQIAAQYSLDIVAGTIIERDSDDNRLYNCSYYIDKDGKIILEYRKVHLWHPERDYLHRGQCGFRTVKNRFRITVGLCVCWDIAFPEAFRHMALEHGAQLVIAPAYWTLEDAGPIGMRYDPLSEVKFIDYVVPARAMENEICMVFCNGANQPEGQEETRPASGFGTLSGATQIAVPFRGTIAHCKSNNEEMIVADVDVAQIISDAEDCYKIRQDWREGKVFGSLKENEVETIVS